MPHVTLEYTNNLPDTVDFKALFAEIHHALVTLAAADIHACKSRAIRLTHFYLGDGSDNNAMVHLNISLLSGRTLDVKKRLNQTCLDILKKYFFPLGSGLNLQFSSNISELDRETYQK